MYMKSYKIHYDNTINNMTGGNDKTINDELYVKHVINKLLIKEDPKINIVLGAHNLEPHIIKYKKCYDLCLTEIYEGGDTDLEDPFFIGKFDFTNNEHVKKLSPLNGKVDNILFDYSTAKFFYGQGSFQYFLPLLKKYGNFFVDISNTLSSLIMLGNDKEDTFIPKPTDKLISRGMQLVTNSFIFLYIFYKRILLIFLVFPHTIHFGYKHIHYLKNIFYKFFFWFYVYFFV